MSVARILRPDHPDVWNWQPRLVVAHLARQPPTLMYQPRRNAVADAWPREPWVHATKLMATLVVSGRGEQPVARRVDARDCGGFKVGQRLQVWRGTDGSGGSVASGRWVDLHTDDAAECEAWLVVLLELPSRVVGAAP